MVLISRSVGKREEWKVELKWRTRELVAASRVALSGFWRRNTSAGDRTWRLKLELRVNTIVTGRHAWVAKNRDLLPRLGVPMEIITYMLIISAR